MMLQADGASPAVLHELRTLFRASPAFSTIQEMQAFATAIGSTCQLETPNSRPVSGVIAGNCVVLERTRHFLGPIFGVYCLGPDGYLMPLPGAFFATEHAALAFAESDAFPQRKVDLISSGEINLHEMGEERVLQLAGGDTNCDLYKQHLIFQASFMQWLHARIESPGNSTSTSTSTSTKPDIAPSRLGLLTS